MRRYHVTKGGNLLLDLFLKISLFICWGCLLHVTKKDVKHISIPKTKFEEDKARIILTLLRRSRRIELLQMILCPILSISFILNSKLQLLLLSLIVIGAAVDWNVIWKLKFLLEERN